MRGCRQSRRAACPVTALETTLRGSPPDEADGRRRRSARGGAARFICPARSSDALSADRRRCLRPVPLLALDIRFVASKNYLGVTVINALVAVAGWYVTRGVVQADTLRERTSYVVAGTAGAVTAVWLS